MTSTLSLAFTDDRLSSTGGDLPPVTPEFMLPGSDGDEAASQQNTSLRALSAVLMALLAVVSFAGNLALCVVVPAAPQLRQFKFNWLLVNLALVNVLDTGVNMLLSLLYVANGRWWPSPADAAFGRATCVLSAALAMLVGIESLAGLALITVERAAVLSEHRSPTHAHLTNTRMKVALVLVWLIGLSLVAPVLVTSIAADVFPTRYLCYVADGSDLYYAVSVVVVHLIQLLVILLATGVIYWRAHQQRVKKRARIPQASDGYADYIISTRVFREHMALARFGTIVLVIFVLLQGPYLIMTYVWQVLHSRQVLDAKNESFAAGQQDMTGADLETAITWLRIIYPVLYPFLVFGFCDEFWPQLAAVLCCQRQAADAPGGTVGMPSAQVARRQLVAPISPQRNQQLQPASAALSHSSPAHFANGAHTNGLSTGGPAGDSMITLYATDNGVMIKRETYLPQAAANGRTIASGETLRDPPTELAAAELDARTDSKAASQSHVLIESMPSSAEQTAARRRRVTPIRARSTSATLPAISEQQSAGAGASTGAQSAVGRRPHSATTAAAAGARMNAFVPKGRRDSDDTAGAPSKKFFGFRKRRKRVSSAPDSAIEAEIQMAQNAGPKEVRTISQ